MDTSVIPLLRPYIYFGGIIAVFALWNYVAKRLGTSRLPLPPGPKSFPIIGNIFDMPHEKAWRVYDDWFKIYGDMVYFKVFGQGYLVLGSTTRISDLLEKRSANYSDRTKMPMLVELMGWNNMAFMPYGLWWRRHRRAFHEHFHAGAVLKYRPIQQREARAFLRRLLATPENFMHHIRFAFSAIIMDICYGIKVSENNDPYISIAEEALDGITQAGVPGQFLVDLLPILKYVPSWMPGAEFKRKAAYWKQVNTKMAEKPFKHVKENLRAGTATPSVVATFLARLPDINDERQEEEEALAKDVGVIAYAGGADTTVSAVQSFFLAMAMYPEVQRKAHAELDAVIGLNKLPDFSNRQSLPYINAIVKETMRWQVVTPLGVGHMCTNDDEYDGYHIPKGTLVLGNVWTLLHNPEAYPSPEEYKPDRWLKDGQINRDIPDPSVAAFGYGRRICPGRHLSDDSLYAMVSLILSVYNITPPVDDQGNPVLLKPEPTSGLLSYPTPFKCIIRPRSGAAEALIHEEHGT